MSSKHRGIGARRYPEFQYWSHIRKPTDMHILVCVHDTQPLHTKVLLEIRNSKENFNTV